MTTSYQPSPEIRSAIIKMSDEYDIVTATEDDKERIAEFLRKYFFTESPVRVASGASPNQRTDEIVGLKYLSQGASLLAVSKDDGRILGVAINYHTTPKDNDSEQSFTKSLSNNPHAKFARFVENNANIWDVTGADRGLYNYAVSVDPAVRIRGIAKALAVRGREVARSMGYPMIWVRCTNLYSIRICRDMGMDAVYRIPYSEYKDEEGKPIFNVAHPHTECVVFAQKLKSKL
ncbi:arylalkylamine N-acetyltransferase-like 2 [Periplaneta americana]|uniref:arylalkylamine N-acetyltransferase-like 2 n=1 Tax=Periplaneta americana TaxID=6978 RepID=UPI0037E8E3B2